MPQPGVATPRGDHDDSDQALGPDGAAPDPWRGFGSRGRRYDAPEFGSECGSGSRSGFLPELEPELRPDEPPPDTGGGRGVPGRRTVTIRGQGSERYVPRRASGSRRPPERRHERAGFQPDRTAMWAVLLGVMLILAAAASAHAATLHALTRLH